MADTRAGRTFRSQEWFDNPNNPDIVKTEGSRHPGPLARVVELPTANRVDLDCAGLAAG